MCAKTKKQYHLNMSLLNLPQNICELLDRIIKANNFNKYSIEVKRAADKGSASELFSITIIEPLCNKKLDILYKIASCDEFRRENFLSSVFLSVKLFFMTELCHRF